jgi:hypothetical protein
MNRLHSMYIIECEKEQVERSDQDFKNRLLIADPERYFNIYEPSQQPEWGYDEGYDIPQGEEDLKKIRREMWRDGLLSPEDIALIETERDA